VENPKNDKITAVFEEYAGCPQLNTLILLHSQEVTTDKYMNHATSQVSF
jgi:hypothetical protein